MNRKVTPNIAILGDGRIGQAVAYYFKKCRGIGRVEFVTAEQQLKQSHLLVGALPGELGEKGLKLALKYRLPLIDISDLDPEFYLDQEAAIFERQILVVPGCGFCPGLMNFLLGREINNLKDPVEDIEVKAGSLSPQDHYFPFLWCFEDLINEHRIPSWQIISGRKKKFAPFAGYQHEKFFDINAESYFSASGFENVLDKVKIKNLKCRVVRPRGFMAFFLFLEHAGYLNKENFMLSKKILESKKEANYTLAEMTLLTRKEKIVWGLKTYAKKNAGLNSMQKITASVAAVLGQTILRDKIKRRGLLFLEDLSGDAHIFSLLLAELKKKGVDISRKKEKRKL